MHRSEVGAGQPATSTATSRASRADRVLEALRHHARNGIVCELPSTLARWLAVSVDTVQRGIRDLLIEGRIEQTPMRSGKAIAYRLLDVASPQADDASPQLAAVETAAGESPPEGGSPAAQSDHRRRPHTISPMEPEDRRHLDEWQWTPELFADQAARSRALLDQLYGLDERERTPAEFGPCDDCSKERRRERLGRFALCGDCASLRHKAALKLTSQVVSAERLPFRCGPPT